MAEPEETTALFLPAAVVGRVMLPPEI